MQNKSLKYQLKIGLILPCFLIGVKSSKKLRYHPVYFSGWSLGGQSTDGD